MDNELTELWKQIAARPDGPLAFRFYLQPTIAALLAIRDGHRDAVAGRPAYLWSVFREKDPDRKSALLRDGWSSIARVFVFALLIDIVYQIIVLHGLRPFQGIIIAVMLALVPYVLLRGPVNRISRGLHHLLSGEKPQQRKGTQT
jgi:hypothetical protein